MLYLIMREVVMGADHRGFELKEKIKKHLRKENWNITDLSPKFKAGDDYPDIAFEVGEEVVRVNGVGILVCGSGAGVCVAANKVSGVRAAIAINPRQTRKMKEDDDINVVCLASDFVGEEENMEMVDEFLKAIFMTEERFIRRVQKIKQYEKLKVS